MAVKISVVTAEVGSSKATSESAELSLTLDAPRLVIGRGDGCEVRLPDPSVSARHASIRQRGAEYTLADEGSSNGTFVGQRKLAPHTPEPLRDGDRVRVGRVWLIIRIGPAMVQGTPAAAARELALALVTRGLRAQGEDPTPCVQVFAGPDQGALLALEEPGRPYALGRARDVELPLSDQAAARRQLTVTRKGDQLFVRNVGTQGATSLDGVPLPSAADVLWRPGQIIAFGATRLACELPVVQALAELERCPDEPLREDDDVAFPEATKPDPGSPPLVDPVPSSDIPFEASSSASSPDASLTAPPASRAPTPSSEPPESRAGWSLMDAAVLLLALGVLAASVAGLSWLLNRG
ncbi:FHA domain-containing protein [Chondromyces crocatus]|uniref:Phosphopeptide-binding protein n=1 Tax=Chondromyces crocatus TaxID=52 RepID=A0A0K1E7D1_CHOCO|nr:FHA domain-containing protein [Chondromyces crocatus]AKT36791.1 phosphopeptide-binding protein [Chondromyces crocatus]